MCFGRRTFSVHLNILSSEGKGALLKTYKIVIRMSQSNSEALFKGGQRTWLSGAVNSLNAAVDVVEWGGEFSRNKKF
jgi:hypothetical protein